MFSGPIKVINCARSSPSVIVLPPILHSPRTTGLVKGKKLCRFAPNRVFQIRFTLTLLTSSTRLSIDLNLSARQREPPTDRANHNQQPTHLVEVVVSSKRRRSKNLVTIRLWALNSGFSRSISYHDHPTQSNRANVCTDVSIHLSIFPYSSA